MSKVTVSAMFPAQQRQWCVLDWRNEAPANETEDQLFLRRTAARWWFARPPPPRSNLSFRTSPIPQLAARLLSDCEASGITPTDLGRGLSSGDGLYGWPQSVEDNRDADPSTTRYLRYKNDHLWVCTLNGRDRVLLHQGVGANSNVFAICRYFSDDQHRLYEKFLGEWEDRFATLSVQLESSVYDSLIMNLLVFYDM